MFLKKLYAELNITISETIQEEAIHIYILSQGIL